MKIKDKDIKIVICGVETNLEEFRNDFKDRCGSKKMEVFCASENCITSTEIEALITHIRKLAYEVENWKVLERNTLILTDSNKEPEAFDIKEKLNDLIEFNSLTTELEIINEFKNLKTQLSYVDKTCDDFWGKIITLEEQNKSLTKDLITCETEVIANSKGFNISPATQISIVTWLRDVHHLMIVIYPLEVSTGGKKAYRFTWIINNLKELELEKNDETLLGFYSYEEATEAAIKCCLTLI